MSVKSMYFPLFFILSLLHLLPLIVKPCYSLKSTSYLTSNRIQRRPFRSIFAFLPINKNSVYIQSLKDQIDLMERQLRQSEMEATQLRDLIRKQTSNNRKSNFETIREQTKIEEHLREVINKLTKQIKDLKRSKVELEELLKQELELMKKNEQKLNDEKVKYDKLMLKSKKEMEEMKDSIMKNAKAQMEKMEKSQVEKFRKELEQVRMNSEKALQEEREKSKTALKRKQTALEEEKRKCQEAVEKERMKMRKLVKVLAEREKRELEWGSKQENSNKRNKKSMEKSRVSGTSANRNVATKARVRGKTKNA